MERLTNKREADSQRKNYKKRLEQGYPRNIPEERFLKLAAYEDTGLEPGQVLDMSENAETALLTWFENRYEIPVGELMRILEAKADGRLLVLPFALGEGAGSEMRAARKRAGMTQSELADRLGTTQQAVAQWETGHRKPKIEAMLKIANALRGDCDD